VVAEIAANELPEYETLDNRHIVMDEEKEYAALRN